MQVRSDSVDPRVKIPPVRDLIRRLEVFPSLKDLPHAAAVRLARFVADHMRAGKRAELSDDALAHLLAPVLRPGPRPVINGTGIFLHTNLGRAPLDRDLVLEALDAVSGYTDLEFDLSTGKRGHRDRHFADTARLLFGVEDALLTNNAAAAVGLSLAALAGGGETVVSRGELIEIGGSFRLPEMMAFAGTRLVEVGTTNKTKLEDYRRAHGPQTACFMKAQPSNFQIEGFTHAVSLEDLCELGRELKVPIVMDLGAGLSDDLPFPEVPEPSIEACLNADPDLLIFSGDKLFSGVQAGIVLGKKAVISKLRKHPMMRMVRLDKLSIAVICRQLTAIKHGRELPLSRLALTPVETLKQRAESILAKLNSEFRGSVQVIAGDAFIGAGALPTEKRPSVCLAIRHEKPNRLAAKLRNTPESVVCYVQQDLVLLNLATVFQDQDGLVADVLNRFLGGF